MTTITIEGKQYAVVPVAPTEEITTAIGANVSAPMNHWLSSRVWKRAIEAAPPISLSAVLQAIAPDFIEDLRDYLDGRADAEYFPDSAAPHPNAEMRLLVKLRELLGERS